MNFEAKFVFEQSNKKFHPGEIVFGTVIVQPLRSFTVYKVEANLKYEIVKGVGLPNESIVVETLAVGEQSEMVLGELYKFPFSFVIPKSAPASYTGINFDLIWGVEISLTLDRLIEKLGAKIEKKKEEIAVDLNPEVTDRSIIVSELHTDLAFNRYLKRYPALLFGIGILAFFGISFFSFTILDPMGRPFWIQFLFFFLPFVGFIIWVLIITAHQVILENINTISTRAIRKRYDRLKLRISREDPSLNLLFFSVDVVTKLKKVDLKRIESTLVLKEQTESKSKKRASKGTILTTQVLSKEWEDQVGDTLSAGVPWSKEFHLDLNELRWPDTFKTGDNTSVRWELAVKLVTNRQNPIIVADLDVTTLVPNLQDLKEEKIQKKLDQLPKGD